MKNRILNLLSCSFLGATMLPVVSCREKVENTKMNILFIMCDDHSFQTISSYNDNFVKTPNIDRIADDGVKFVNSFVANSLSGPSRACMLTGKHSYTNGFTDNTKQFDNSQQTFPKLLRSNGYETAVIGKWHLVSEPTGFEHWDILVGQGTYYNPLFIRNGEKIQRKGYATNITTDLAIEWLDSIRDKNKPFCLLLHHKAPHRTWMPDTCDLDLFTDKKYPLPENFNDDYKGRIAAASQEMSIAEDMDLVYDLKLADKENEIHSNKWLEKAGRQLYSDMDSALKAAWDAHYDEVIADFKEKNLSGEALTEWKYTQYMRDYLRVITSIDRNVGRVLDYLSENGLDKNTLVVYTSDQGFYMGEHGWFDKRFMYEESFRTPLLMRYPNGANGEVLELVQNIDYAPTFLDVAGVEIPQDIQGLSLLPLLKGEKQLKGRDALYYHFFEYPAEHMVKKHNGVRTDRYKLIHFYDDIDVWELYDLEKDPNEMNNIYGQVGTENIIEELKEKLADLQKKYGEEGYISK